MRDDELDRILSRHDDLEPSSGFTRNVMDAVRQEAMTPASIPFPWKRVLPGLILCVLALSALCVAAFVRPGAQPLREVSGPSIWTAMWTGVWTALTDLGGLLRAANAGGWGWIMLALLLTFASITLALSLVRFMGRRI